MTHTPRPGKEFPNLDAIKAFDRQQHVQKGIESGLTREQAEEHADKEMAHWSPRHVERNVDED